MIPTPPPSTAPDTWAYNAFDKACSDCNQSEGSSKLPDDKLTDQCTDQCVVITCDDPEHDAICSGAGGLVHCDLDCDDATDCTDCNGFDAFLQCCNDDAFCQGISASNSGSSNGSMWAAMQEWCITCDTVDQSISAYPNSTPVHSQHQLQKHPGHREFPTSSYPQSHRVSPSMLYSQNLSQSSQHVKHPYTMTEPPTNYGHQANDPRSHQDRYHRSGDFRMQKVENVHPTFSQSQIHDSSEGFTPRTHSGSYSSNGHGRESSLSASSVDGSSFFSSPYMQTPPATTTTPTFNCMWSACQASFSSMPDLVNHVNQNHLAITHGMTGGAQVDNQKERSCLWGGCDDTSFFSVSDSDQFLNHLLSVHLHTSPMDWQPHATPQIGGPSHFEQTLVGSSVISSTPSSSTPVSGLSTPTSKSSDAPAELPPDDTVAPQAGAPQSQAENHAHDGGCTSAAGAQHVHECRWKDCEHKSFTTCDELTAHISEVHIGGGRAHYECFWDGCTRNGDQGFQSKQKICRHVQSHTGHRPFQCTICHQNFSEAATLQQHIRRHTQEKPYVCDFPGCGKSFAITGALTIHKRTHNGDKPFKCTYCDRGFAESSNLSKHLRTHTGARPYECTEPGCNKAFARPDQLNRHKAVHKKQIRGVGGQVGVQ